MRITFTESAEEIPSALKPLGAGVLAFNDYKGHLAGTETSSRMLKVVTIYLSKKAISNNSNIQDNFLKPIKP